MPDNSQYFKTHGSLMDGGPVYTETHPGQFIVEPWNAVSSLALIVPAVFWLYRLRQDFTKFRFLSLCIPLLILGGLGSTFFHAFRISKYLLLLDALPIQLLTLLVSLYLWMQLFKRWYWLFGVALLFVISKFSLDDFFPPHDVININYFINGTIIFLPALLILRRLRNSATIYFFSSLFLFSLSLIFRKIDSNFPPVMPMGTHWLWHVFSAAGAFTLSLFLYQVATRNKLIKAETN